ncbi:hypothetical protein ACH42_09990 [Endozoicomonas sp. (ex Bugula neritina AB1)]|nr:hypothetical protein ACH42_09990 [Endozoicomonas sp. (ex Bugula neritina AB1)]
MFTLFLMTFQLMFNTTSAAPNEHWYQDVWCKGMKGEVEYRLEDGRRIDCLTDTYAIEVEFAHKWPEAIGQSLDYSMLTNKNAGIVLILRKPTDQEHCQRLEKVIQHYQLPIRAWRLGP